MRALVAGFCFTFLTGLLSAQVPGTLSYQGILTDASGDPVADGISLVTFSFFTVATGGSVIDSRGPISVNTSKGLFTTVIGDGTANNAALPASLFSSELWIGIKVGATDLVPRVRITAAPYANRAQVANVLDASATVAGAQVGTGINASNITTGTLPLSVLPSDAGVPVGTIIAYAGTTVPNANWLFCDGSVKTLAQYPKLASAIGNTWGGTSTDFNLPDLRGTFLRGWNSAGSKDPDASLRTASNGTTVIGNVVGSYQDDRFQGHKHTAGPTSGPGAASGTYPWRVDSSGVGTSSDPVTDGVNGTPRTSSETRPKNAYVNYIIKAQ